MFLFSTELLLVFSAQGYFPAPCRLLHLRWTLVTERVAVLVLCQGSASLLGRERRTSPQVSGWLHHTHSTHCAPQLLQLSVWNTDPMKVSEGSFFKESPLASNRWTVRCVSGFRSRTPSASSSLYDSEVRQGERVLVAGQRTGIVQFCGKTSFAPG